MNNLRKMENNFVQKDVIIKQIDDDFKGDNSYRVDNYADDD